MIAVCGGVFAVPLYAILQHESDPQYRARTISSNNVINAAFMVVAALITVAMLAVQFSIPQIFLSLGVANIAIVFLAMKLKQPV